VPTAVLLVVEVIEGLDGFKNGGLSTLIDTDDRDEGALSQVDREGIDDPFDIFRW